MAAAVVKVIVCVKMSRRERAPLSSSLVAANRAGDEVVVEDDRRDEMDEKASASFARERSKMVSAAADFMVVLCARIKGGFDDLWALTSVLLGGVALLLPVKFEPVLRAAIDIQLRKAREGP